MGVNFFWKSLVAPCDKASQGTDVFSGRDNLLRFCICLGGLSGFLGKDRGQEISVERKETEKENIIYYKGRALVTEAWEGMEMETFAYLIGWKLTLSYFSIFGSPPGLAFSSRDSTRGCMYVLVDRVGG